MRLIATVQLALLLLVLSSSNEAVEGQLIEAPWPMFLHDSQHPGRSEYSGPERPSEKLSLTDLVKVASPCCRE